MPINYNDFIFHSDRIPFGATDNKEVTIPLGGAVTMSGKTVTSDLIPIGTFNVSPRLVYTIPSGTWYTAVGGVIASGTRLMSGSFRYIAQSSPDLRQVTIRPFVQYESNGIRVGVKMDMSYSGSNPGSVTVPTSTLKLNIFFDVIPNNTK